MYALFINHMKEEHTIYFKINQLKAFSMPKDKAGKTVLIRGPIFFQKGL